MKRYTNIIRVAAVAVFAPSAFAQGTFVFANDNRGLVMQWTSATDSMLIPVPRAGGEVQLFWAPAGTPYTPWSPSLTPEAWTAANPGWKLESPAGLNTSIAGRFNGGTLTLFPLSSGGDINYVVVGWTGQYLSFDAALASGAMANVSDKFSSRTGDPNMVPPEAPVLLSSTFTGMTLLPVPEPSTLALASLGTATLLALRRRE